MIEMRRSFAGVDMAMLAALPRGVSVCGASTLGASGAKQSLRQLGHARKPAPGAHTCLRLRQRDCNESFCRLIHFHRIR
jgi:hypothetical protein